jgi:transcription elongation factor Elf1
MKINVKHILEGITNSMFVKQEVEKIANERHALCKVCPKNSSNHDKEGFDPGAYYNKLRPDEHCSMCACNLHAKVRSLHTDCPIDKWKAVADNKEAAQIAIAIDDF